MQKKETIIDTPAYVLWFYPDQGLLHHVMRKYPGVEILESSLEKGLDLIKNRGATKWLSDDRRGGALPKSHHDWALRVWGPKAAAAGWKWWALLPPTELLGSANMARLAEIYGALGVFVRTFGDPDAATKWLASCDAASKDKPGDR